MKFKVGLCVFQSGYIDVKATDIENARKIAYEKNYHDINWLGDLDIYVAGVEKTKLFCKKCGKELPDDSTYCSYCGQKVE